MKVGPVDRANGIRAADDRYDKLRLSFFACSFGGSAQLILHPPGRTNGFPIELLATRDLYDSWDATTGTDSETLSQFFDNIDQPICLEFTAP